METGRRKRKQNEVLAGIVFLGPSAVLFVIAMVIPFCMAVGYSFTDWNGISKSKTFIALQNYIDIFSGKTNFLDSFQFTFMISILIVVLTMVLGIAIAAALTSDMKGKNLFRTIFFLPQTMGGVVLGFVWRFIFIIGFQYIGSRVSLNIFKIAWLGTPGTAFAGLVIVSVWQSVGYIMVLMIAAMVGVPKDLLESADLDGANRWDKLFKIQLPCCMPTITVCLFWSISNTFKMFDLNVALTKGGPFGSTTSMGLRIYNEAFANNNFGLATAESVVFFLTILVLTGIQMGISRKKEAQFS